MAFHFLCPQGHVLQADPAHSGQAINCPICGVLFIIPAMQSIPGIEPVSQAASGGEPPAADSAAEAPAQEDPLDFPRHGRRIDWSTDDAEESPSAPSAQEESLLPLPRRRETLLPQVSAPPPTVHINCPKGHELTTSLEMMEQEVLCPFCGEQFVLHYTSSKEYRLAKQSKLEFRERKLGQEWLTWAVVAGVMVLVMIVTIIYFSMH